MRAYMQLHLWAVGCEVQSTAKKEPIQDSVQVMWVLYM
jgi:hypothetical protein